MQKAKKLILITSLLLLTNYSGAVMAEDCDKYLKSSGNSTQYGQALLKRKECLNKKKNKKKNKEKMILGILDILFSENDEKDRDWDWDAFYDQYGRLVWRCRGIQTGRFDENDKCLYDSKDDNRWPNK